MVPHDGLMENPNDDHAEERAFLHSISTPISTLGLLAESLIESAHTRPSNTAEAETLAKMQSLVTQIFGLIQERRRKITDTDLGP